MKVAIYARVSTDGQEQRGTIGSQVEALRSRMAAEGREIVAEFLDDGYSGARLDRPGLDALRRSQAIEQPNRVVGVRNPQVYMQGQRWLPVSQRAHRISHHPVAL